MTNEEISTQKSQLRARCIAVRKALDANERADASLRICSNIEGWQTFLQSGVILTYMPIKSEVDLTSLLGRCPQKKWVLPRISPEEDHRMVFHPYDANRLVRHPFGMAEPASDLPVIQPEEIELALVPGLAFDRHGFRLGYGGGYFDRFLKDFNGVSAGIAFHALLVDEVPRDGHDIAMNWIITEKGLFEAK